MNTATALPMSEAVMNLPDDENIWRAVLDRSRQLDGIFYYGVRSTGIFCRPSCPSRRPRRENVDFFLDTETAKKAGLRACRRCNPEQAIAGDRTADEVKAIARYIEENLEGTLTLKTIAAAVDKSTFHVHRVFKNVLGITPQEYISVRRHSLLRTALRLGHSVADATYAAGFNSSRAVYEQANAHLGMSPSVYKKGAPRQEIRYAIVDSPLGKLLVASTEKGICRIALDDNAASLKKLIFAEFPKSLIHEDSSSLRNATEAILAYLTNDQSSIELPLDLKATAFQMRVWRELQKIPLGETLTYEELAERVGQRRAVRAVARACATNPVALVVPCHRIIRKNGGLGGYRWGTSRKQHLLDMERAGRQKVASAKA